jgi:hypothetical protein
MPCSSEYSAAQHNMSRGEKEGLEKIASFKQTFNIPYHVLSVKSLDDYKRNEEMNEATPTDPPRQITETFEPHPDFRGGI